VQRGQFAGTFLLWALALVAGQIWSHDLIFPLEPDAVPVPSAGPLWRALAALPDLGWLAPGIAAALLAGARRPRRALAAVLAALVVALAFAGAWQAGELGPHSIVARDRAVDSGAAHLTALPVEVSTVPAPPLVVQLGTVNARSSLLPRSALLAPAHGRAPPLRSA